MVPCSSGSADARADGGSGTCVSWNTAKTASSPGRIVTSLYTAARAHLPGMRLRTDYTDADPDQEADFYLLRHTLAPAVLMENLFMDNPTDCAFLLSEEGQQALVDLHVDGIISYLGV